MSACRLCGAPGAPPWAEEGVESPFAPRQDSDDRGSTGVACYTDSGVQLPWDLSEGMLVEIDGRAFKVGPGRTLVEVGEGAG